MRNKITAVASPGVPGLIHHFATAVLAGAKRRALDEKLLMDGAANLRKQRWDADDLVRFLRALGTLGEDEFYGLAASRCPPGAASLGIELMLLSESLGDAIERCCRFYALVTNGLRFDFNEHKGMASIQFTAADGSLDEAHFLIEWHAARWHRLTQWLIGEKIPLTCVEFAHSRQWDLAEYRQVFGENCLFRRPVNRISFPRSYLNRKIVRRMADFQDTKANHNGMLSSADVHQSWYNLLKSSLCARLARRSPMPTMDELAVEFGICSQTLRRRLKAESSSYRKLKAEARREVVLDNISDGSLTLGQVSLLAGFADTNGLVRAIKSWTGLSPSQYRKAAMDGQPDYRCADGKTVN
jgi:AraC-like DNA-binding protein